MRQAHPLMIALVLLGGSLSGCTNQQPPPEDPLAGADILPGIPLANLTHFMGDPLHAHTDTSHDHADPAQHIGSFQIDAIGHVPPSTEGSASELDIQGDYAYQCEGTGFRILDITNRSAPVLAAVYTGSVSCRDVKVTKDGAYAIVMGREVVDVRNKEEPERVVDDSGGFCHMCYIHEIADQEYVFMARDEPHAAPGAAPAGAGVGIWRLERDPVQLVRVGSYVVAPEKRANTHLPDADVYSHQVHDMLVYNDPILGNPIMLAAYWDLGVRIVDVSDPASPVELGAWDDFKGDLGDIHTVGVDFLDERRILAAATENGAIIDPIGSASGYSAGFVYLIDITDIDDPVTLGKWINPGKHSSGPETVGVYSMHNIQFLEGRVYVAHYHAGVWVLDAEGFVATATVDAVRTAQREDDVPTWGYFFPTTSDKGPDVWDVVVKDGYLYTSDIGNGLHVLRFHGDPLGDPAFTSVG